MVDAAEKKEVDGKEASVVNLRKKRGRLPCLLRNGWEISSTSSSEACLTEHFALLKSQNLERDQFDVLQKRQSVSFEVLNWRNDWSKSSAIRRSTAVNKRSTTVPAWPNISKILCLSEPSETGFGALKVLNVRSGWKKGKKVQLSRQFGAFLAIESSTLAYWAYRCTIYSCSRLLLKSQGQSNSRFQINLIKLADQENAPFLLWAVGIFTFNSFRCFQVISNKKMSVITTKRNLYVSPKLST